MKRLIGIVSLLVLIACANAESKATFGLDLRSRMIMSSVGTTTDADTQFMSRYTDFRIRPNFYYQANDMLSAKVVLEVGDVKFGTPGAQYDTDGINVETKHAYLDVKPNKDNMVRLGLMAYNDPHSLILDGDLAGVKYEGSFDQLNLGLGWYVTEDNGEKNGDKKTWSYGRSYINANLGFKINDKMSVDLTTLTEMSSVAMNDTTFSTEVGHEDEVKKIITHHQANKMNMWFAPRFVGDFGMVNVDGTFVYNMRGATTYEKAADGAGDEPDAKDDGSGMAFSLKSNIKANEQLTVGVNFLFASANDVKAKEEKYDGYQPAEFVDSDGEKFYASYVENGLQILTQGGIGENETLGGSLFTDHGIMLPSVTVDYKVNDMATVGGAFGMAMTLEDVKSTVDGKEVKDTSLGMEFGVNSKIKLFEKLNLTPYAAFFMPGKAYTNMLNNADDDDANNIDKTDMQMKIGAHLTISF